MKVKKRIALMLSVFMILSVMPFGVFAQEIDNIEESGTITTQGKENDVVVVTNGEYDRFSEEATKLSAIESQNENISDPILHTAKKNSLVLDPKNPESDKKVDLYAIDSSWEDGISIPSSLDTSIQISVTGSKKVSYSLVSGESVAVSDSGLVKPAGKTWYYYGNYGTTFPMDDSEPTRIVTKYNYGESKIKVMADNVVLYVTVNLIDYVDYYTNSIIDDWIAQHVTDSMTAEERITESAKMAASYEYDNRHSSASGMIVYGGGDCWASTSLIIQFCKKLGYDSWLRNGSHDYGAGSGHRNAMVEAEGKYYEVEAGYYADAPRPYYVRERQSLYGYQNDYDLDGICVIQYDGKTKPENMKIPEKIDNKKVVGIGEEFLCYADGIKSITLPETIEYISDGAFYGCDMECINIPRSLTTIGNFVFTNCDQLTSIECDKDNAYFSSSGTVLYNKDKTTLLYAPAVKSMVVPSSVETIGYYAFYYNDSLKNITMTSVVNIEEGAFCYCTDLESVNFGKKLKSLGNYACAADWELKKIILPATLTNVGEAIFDDCTNLQSVCYGGSEQDWNKLGIADDCFSTAKFEFNYDIKFVWDVNQDGVMDIKDARLAKRIALKAAKTNEYTEAGLKAGDLDGNGKITINEARMIKRAVLKEITF